MLLNPIPRSLLCHCVLAGSLQHAACIIGKFLSHLCSMAQELKYSYLPTALGSALFQSWLRGWLRESLSRMEGRVARTGAGSQTSWPELSGLFGYLCDRRGLRSSPSIVVLRLGQ